MKFTIDKSILYKAVSKVQRASDKNAAFAPIQGILLEANGQSLKLTATNLSLTIQCIVEDVDVAVLGRALIPAKFFSDLLRKLSGTITIETVYENGIKLYCGDLTATIHTIDHDEFPGLPVISEAKELFTQTKILKTMLAKTLFATSSDDNRPVFTGILFKASKGNIDFVATDTRRLTKFNHFIGFPGEINVIVPGKAMKELVKVFDGKVVKVSFTDSYAVFECENTKLITKLIEGQYPNYEEVLPKDPKATISADKATIKNAIERANVFSDRFDGSIVHLSGKDSLVISGSSSIFGDIKQTIKVEHDGEEVRAAFNCEFLLQAINAMTGDKVHINYFGACAPMTFCEEGYLQLILPVRV